MKLDYLVFLMCSFRFLSGWHILLSWQSPTLNFTTDLVNFTLPLFILGFFFALRADMLIWYTTACTHNHNINSYISYFVLMNNNRCVGQTDAYLAGSLQDHLRYSTVCAKTDKHHQQQLHSVSTSWLAPYAYTCASACFYFNPGPDYCRFIS